jgi:predicted dehydrogenase
MGSLSASNKVVTPKFLIIGAGSRGNSYAHSVKLAGVGTIQAIADIDEFKRKEFGRKYIWGDGQPQAFQEFASWQDWIAIAKERREMLMLQAGEDAVSAFGVGVAGVFICTLDETHADIIRALAPFKLHIMCEKPLALSLSDCLSVSEVVDPARQVLGMYLDTRHTIHF